MTTSAENQGNPNANGEKTKTNNNPTRKSKQQDNRNNKQLSKIILHVRSHGLADWINKNRYNLM